MSPGSITRLFLAAVAGALLSYGVSCLTTGSADQSQKILAMEGSIKNLQLMLAKKDEELKDANEVIAQQATRTIPAASSKVAATAVQNRQEQTGQVDSAQPAVNTAPSSIDILKSLETVSDNDPRPFSDKLKDLLSNNQSRDKIAIASRSIFDMARDRQSLPDYTLQSIYNNQSDPGLKRVIAQVMSQRGNGSLIDNQIAAAQSQLKSQDPKDRQDALNQLAKIHSIKAVDAIAPYLLDPDTDVKLDALQALRNTGNQKNIGLVEMLVNDPDPSVSSLASDVLANLKNLSSSARTTPSRSDIEAELPPIQN